MTHLRDEAAHIMMVLLNLSRASRFLIPCFLVAVAVAADDDATDSDADSDSYFQLEKCVSTARIRSTDIIDDRTIVFRMNQNKFYVNQLPRRCAGLKIAGTFSYRTVASRLCDIDVITVVRSFGGRASAGPRCGLGKFRPVTEEEVAMLKNREIEQPPEEPAQSEDETESQSGEGEPDDDAPNSDSN